MRNQWVTGAGGTLVLGLTLCSGVATSLPVSTECAPLQPPDELVKPKPRRGAAQSVIAFRGIVRDIGGDWVELAAGWKRVSAQDEIENPKDKTKEPKRISAAGTTVGGDQDGVGYATYRLADLKAGDQLFLFTAVSRDGEEFTVQIVIERRPGGRIPRLPGGPFPEVEGERHHLYQAHQDWEEKGIPIPARYLPPSGRVPWVNPPYPPVAPPPREVKK